MLCSAWAGLRLLAIHLQNEAGNSCKNGHDSRGENPPTGVTEPRGGGDTVPPGKPLESYLSRKKTSSCSEYVDYPRSSLPFTCCVWENFHLCLFISLIFVSTCSASAVHLIISCRWTAVYLNSFLPWVGVHCAWYRRFCNPSESTCTDSDFPAGLGIRSFAHRSFAHFAQINWVTVSDLLRSFKTNEWLWANRSGCSRQMSDHERFAQVAHDKWSNENFAQKMLATKI